MRFAFLKLIVALLFTDMTPYIVCPNCDAAMPLTPYVLHECPNCSNVFVFSPRRSKERVS